LAAIVCDEREALSKYVYRMLCQVDARDISPDQNYPSLRLNEIGNIQIPLPPLDVQQEIVGEIEGYQKVIDGARAVVENYRPHIHVESDWQMVELGALCERIQYGLSSRLNTENKGYKTFRMNELVKGMCTDQGTMKCADISTDDYNKYKLNRGDILFNRTNSFEHVGRTGLFDLDGEYCFASYLIRLTISDGLANPYYVNAFMNTKGFQAGIKQYASRAIGQANINAKSLAAYRIPLPPTKTQEAIVAELDAEQALVNVNSDLTERMEKKIRAVVGRVWGKVRRT
jgi:restriction endonuclease S subunit